MEHGKALGMKALMILPVMWIILTLIYDVSFWGTTVLALVLIALAYAIGDMGILPRTSNMAATISDFVLSLIVVWIGLNIMGIEDAFVPSLITAIVIAAGEYFYHKWLIKNEFNPVGENRRLSEDY